MRSPYENTLVIITFGRNTPTILVIFYHVVDGATGTLYGLTPPLNHKPLRFSTGTLLKSAINFCTRNVKRVISSHNRKLLEQSSTEETANNCNCRVESGCAVKGKCLTKNIVYKDVLTTANEKDARDKGRDKRWTDELSFYQSATIAISSTG